MMVKKNSPQPTRKPPSIKPLNANTANKMDWYAHVTVAAVIEQQQRFLLVEEHSAGQRVFNQPAGHLEAGESLQQAVIREVLEETCHHFIPTAIIGIYQYHSKHNDTSYLRFCFTGDCSDQDASKQLDSDIVAIQWLTLEEIHIAQQQKQLRSPMVFAEC